MEPNIHAAYRVVVLLILLQQIIQKYYYLHIFVTKIHLKSLDLERGLIKTLPTHRHQYQFLLRPLASAHYAQQV